MATLYQYVPNRVIGANGISDGASIYFYQSGTTTLITIYSDEDATFELANPVVVATGAAVPDVYWTFSGGVRVRVVEANGTVPSDIDPYVGPRTSLDYDTWTAAKTAADADPTLPGMEAAAIVGLRPMDGAFFGIREGTNRQTIVQNAINDAAGEGINVLDLPGGRIRCEGDVYCHYDASNNPNFPNLSEPVPMTLRGIGAGSRVRMIENSDVLGGSDEGATRLHFDDGKLIYGDGTATGIMGGGLQDMAITKDGAGDAVLIDYAPIRSRFSNLLVWNRGGSGIHVRSSWISEFCNIDIWGRPGWNPGRGFWLDNGSGTTGGGQNIFRNITASYFAEPLRFCNRYQASGNTQQRANILMGIQARYGGAVNASLDLSALNLDEGVGICFGQGFSGKLDGSWLEFNEVCDIRVADRCNRVKLENLHSNNGSCSEAHIAVGYSGGSGNESHVLKFIYDGGDVPCGFADGSPDTATPGIIFYATSNTPYRKIRAARLIDQTAGSDPAVSPVGIMVESGDKGGLLLDDIDWTTLAQDERLRNTANTANRWDVARGYGATGVQESGTTDLSALRVLPESYRCTTTSADCTITLPNDRTLFRGWSEDTVFIKYQTANQVVLDAGTGNTIAGAQTYSFGSGAAHKALTIRPRDTGTAIDWQIAGAA